MSEITNIKKNIGEQIADLLKRQPQNYDVVFSVGPEKIQVKGVKIVLKAASPVFEREFVEKWEIGVTKEGEGIPLRDIEPTVFELFVNLIISDTWAVDHLRSLHLTPNTLLSLLGLCRRFEILKGIENLEAASKDFIRSFPNYIQTGEFLEMSHDNLRTILAFENIPLEELEIFGCACKWAEHQCKQKKIMEPTGENFREVLGSCFFEIRFPTMKFEDFTAVSRFKTNIFSAEEKVKIYDFIGMKEEDKAKYDDDKSLHPFKTNPRIKQEVISQCIHPAVRINQGRTKDFWEIPHGPPVSNTLQMGELYRPGIFVSPLNYQCSFPPINFGSYVTGINSPPVCSGASFSNGAKCNKSQVSQLPFNESPLRNSRSLEYLVLRLPKRFKITDNPQFVCDGTLTCNSFSVSKAISLYGIGFFGPADGDTHFDVTVQIKGRGHQLNSGYGNSSGCAPFRKTIFAQKRKVFHFFFDKPISIQPIGYGSSFSTSCNFIEYTLKGPLGVSQYQRDANITEEKVHMSGVEFTLGCSWKLGTPLAELLFKKV